MGLVTWSRDRRDGQGLSGTRYRVVPAGRSGEADRRWLVEVDSDVFCATDAAQDAISQIERLEALRCVMCGLAPELGALQLAQAGSVAAEMREAAEQALSDGRLSDEQRAEVRRNILELSGLIRLIAHKGRESDPVESLSRVLH